jgi:spermidine synthase
MAPSLTQRECPALQPFFEAMHRAVRVGGVICTQAESLWLHMEVIQSLAGMCSKVSGARAGLCVGTAFRILG